MFPVVHIDDLKHNGCKCYWIKTDIESFAFTYITHVATVLQWCIVISTLYYICGIHVVIRKQVTPTYYICILG